MFHTGKTPSWLMLGIGALAIAFFAVSLAITLILLMEVAIESIHSPIW